MSEHKLPVDELSDHEFDDLKEMLRKSSLLDSDIERIAKEIGIGDPDIAPLICGQEHSHNINCYTFYDPVPYLFQRLLDDRNQYRDLILKRS
jgi:hypothetical protein